MLANSHIGFRVDDVTPNPPSPQSVIVGPSFVYKFRVDRIYSLGVIGNLIFCRFALKLSIHMVISRDAPIIDILPCR